MSRQATQAGIKVLETMQENGVNGLLEDIGPTEGPVAPEEPETKFDFEDGKGPVPAARHMNPNGSIGGWVAKTAKVEKTAYVGENARVSGNARVYGDAQVSGNAWVYGDALVYGNARVSGNARVYGDAQVSGNAWVYGDAEVYGDVWIRGTTEIRNGTVS